MRLIQKEKGYYKSFIFINSQKENDYVLKQLEDEGYFWLSGDKPTARNYYDKQPSPFEDIFLAVIAHYETKQISFVKGTKDKLQKHIEDFTERTNNHLLVCKVVMNAEYEEID
ncbi:MAG: hypothetical protein PHC62_06895 [Candidatus Izemoplasmatales bacterium]|nr:hypothetical protein [Candidatus Izemoplasmatales bacterium]